MQSFEVWSAQTTTATPGFYLSISFLSVSVSVSLCFGSSNSLSFLELATGTPSCQGPGHRDQTRNPQDFTRRPRCEPHCSGYALHAQQISASATHRIRCPENHQTAPWLPQALNKFNFSCWFGVVTLAFLVGRFLSQAFAVIANLASTQKVISKRGHVCLTKCLFRSEGICAILELWEGTPLVLLDYMYQKKSRESGRLKLFESQSVVRWSTIADHYSSFMVVTRFLQPRLLYLICNIKLMVGKHSELH